MKFKNLESSDILISSFEVNKTFTVTNNDTGSGVYPFQITKATDANLYGWGTDTGLKTTLSGSSFYSIPNYYVINNMFYRDLKQMYEVDPNNNGGIADGRRMISEDSSGESRGQIGADREPTAAIVSRHIGKRGAAHAATWREERERFQNIRLARAIKADE